MKKIILLIGFIISTFSIVNACDIKLEVVGTTKTTYKIGEEIVVKATMIFTHGNCGIDLKETKFTPTGMKIKSATNWKEVSPGVFERKFKLILTKSDDDKHSFTSNRQCRKGGGNSILNFNSLATKK